MDVTLGVNPLQQMKTGLQTIIPLCFAMVIEGVSMLVANLELFALQI